MKRASGVKRQTPTVDEAALVLMDNTVITCEPNSGRFDIVMKGVANKLRRPLAVWQQRDEHGDRAWFWIAVLCDPGDDLSEAPADLDVGPVRRFRMVRPA